MNFFRTIIIDFLQLMNKIFFSGVSFFIRNKYIINFFFSNTIYYFFSAQNKIHSTFNVLIIYKLNKINTTIKEIKIKKNHVGKQINLIKLFGYFTDKERFPGNVA